MVTQSEGHIPVPSENSADNWLMHYRYYLRKGQLSQAFYIRQNFYAAQAVTQEQWEKEDQEFAHAARMYQGIENLLLGYFETSPFQQNRANFSRWVLNYILGDGNPSYGGTVNLRKWVTRRLQEKGLDTHRE